MDRIRWSIFVGLTAVLLCAGASVALALLTPFNVTRPVTIEVLQGDVSLHIPGKPSEALSPEQDWFPSIQANQALHLAPDSSATVLFTLNGGRAILTGPADVRLIASYRRATALGHTLDSQRYDRSYILTLDQSLGEVRYLFNHADPSFEDIAITIHLPDRDYVPATPCWTIVVNPDGSADTASYPCPS